jgi:prephenate dehydrogenase
VEWYLSHGVPAGDDSGKGVKMTVKVTIIGLGQIGASMGLALASHKDQVTITGHDKSQAVARMAQKAGAVDKISFNLPASVEGADVIILALPLDEIYKTLKFIARDVREEAVLMDTAPAKTTVSKWVKELMPPKRHYVGLTPALNPKVLENTSRGLDAAQADLFSKGFIAISTPEGTPEEALKLATGFVNLLQAEPYFVDLAEIDGIMASAHLLPGLAASSLTGTIMAQPGWPDIRKMAGKSFTAAMRLFEMEEPTALAELFLQNKENTMRVLDDYIASLQSLREDIAGESDKKLSADLSETGKGLENWRHERYQSNWQEIETGREALPKISDILKQQVGGLDKLFGPRKKKPDRE